MSLQSRLVDGAIIVIALCALSVTGLAARNAGLFGGSVATATSSTARKVPQLEAITRESNWIGPRNAPIVITEFADFECPVCQRLKPTIDSLRATAPDRIAIAFVHFPLSRIHPHAYRAAMVAECGAQQDRFEATYDALFSVGPSLGTVTTAEWAEAVGVTDTTAFRTCMDIEAGRTRIERHLAYASDLGLNGTPAFAVNDVLFVPGTSIKEVADSIASALQRRQ